MQNEETKPVEGEIRELDDLALEQVAGGCSKMKGGNKKDDGCGA